MTDLISRQALLKELPHANWGKEWDEALAKAIIESMPTIDPAENGGCWGCRCALFEQAPVKHGGVVIPAERNESPCDDCDYRSDVGCSWCRRFERSKNGEER